MSAALSPAERFATLTPVQQSVFKACCHKVRDGFMGVTSSDWYRADPPFRGEHAAFARHLRTLAELGLLLRQRDGGHIAYYRLSLLGESLLDWIEADR